MIWVDASEWRSKSTMPDLTSLGESLKWSDTLEELTGADIFITPKKYPINSVGIIQNHLNAGAVMLQVKRGFDLAASVGERLEHSLAKMRSLCFRHVQCVLVFVGRLERGLNGEAMINGRNAGEFVPGTNWKRCKNAQFDWGARGGWVETIEDDPETFVQYLQEIEKRTFKYQEMPFLVSFPPSTIPMIRETVSNGETERIKPALGDHNDPLQVVRRATEQEAILAALDGVGPKRALAAMKYYGCPAFAIADLTDPDFAKRKSDKRPEGIGPGTAIKVRKQLFDGRKARLVIEELDD